MCADNFPLFKPSYLRRFRSSIAEEAGRAFQEAGREAAAKAARMVEEAQRRSEDVRETAERRVEEARRAVEEAVAAKRDAEARALESQKREAEALGGRGEAEARAAESEKLLEEAALQVEEAAQRLAGAEDEITRAQQSAEQEVAEVRRQAASELAALQAASDGIVEDIQRCGALRISCSAPPPFPFVIATLVLGRRSFHAASYWRLASAPPRPARRECELGLEAFLEQHLQYQRAPWPPYSSPPAHHPPGAAGASYPPYSSPPYPAFDNPPTPTWGPVASAPHPPQQHRGGAFSDARNGAPFSAPPGTWSNGNPAQLSLSTPGDPQSPYSAPRGSSAAAATASYNPLYHSSNQSPAPQQQRQRQQQSEDPSLAHITGLSSFYGESGDPQARLRGAVQKLTEKLRAEHARSAVLEAELEASRAGAAVSCQHQTLLRAPYGLQTRTVIDPCELFCPTLCGCRSPGEPPLRAVREPGVRRGPGEPAGGHVRGAPEGGGQGREGGCQGGLGSREGCVAAQGGGAAGEGQGGRDVRPAERLPGEAGVHAWMPLEQMTINPAVLFGDLIFL